MLTADEWKNILGTFGPLLTLLLIIIASAVREKPAWVPGWLYREKDSALKVALQTIQDLHAANDRTNAILADVLAAVRNQDLPTDPAPPARPLSSVRQHRPIKRQGGAE